MLLSLNTRAQSALKQADEQYNLYNYSKAVGYYLKAYKKDSTLYIAEHLANSYRLMDDYNNAETWYAKAAATKGSGADVFLKYGDILKSNGKYIEAKVQYTRYYVLRTDVDKNQLRVLTAGCDSAVKWMKSPTGVDLKNEQTLNSAESDWGASNYGNNIVFTSDRFGKKGGPQHPRKKGLLYFDQHKGPDTEIYGWTGDNYLKLYQAGKTGNSTDTVNFFPFSAGTEYHVSAPSFTADGNEMYFTLTKIPAQWNDTARIKTIKLEIYSSKKNAGANTWSAPVPFKYNNQNQYSVGDPFITPDGKTLYFVSDMPGGLGGTDIYYSQKDSEGNWGGPVNLKSVNSTGNERTPFIDENKDIYFSSDNGITLGGLDIFKAIHTTDDKFGPKQNLRYPVNSPRDDFAYVVYGGTTGYLSSNRLGGVGSDDIYSFTQKPVAAIRLEGVVYDKKSRQPVANSLVTLSKVGRVTTNATGRFSFNLQENADYTLRGEKATYLSDNQLVSTKGITENKTIRKDLYIDKIELNKAIKIENIYYDFDKSNIRPDAAVELDKLIKVLKDNPNIDIEIGSHTDSKGNDAYNMALSQRRANSVVQYLITVGGIDESRLSSRGYGESRLLNRCSNGVDCSPAEHQLNRRTEFTIVKM
ncbi:OmpA family protein [Mucilaginibacter gynuensis]|uniref:OmpA family protein n=2 Tax=Mucilaginibacter gynuensis TaxID=1302236 RepID=A0ABP8FM10_9SPHI